ncbi:MAG TPA: alpha/beta hydrolase-fold protein [candidate division Zixibacteria bacterium]|nr:alpha/beta hydrolase-fold protein [candidate division Zixibacteria bacterium]
MKLYHKLLIAFLGLLLLASLGCSNRGTNSNNKPNIEEGGILKKEGAHVFSTELAFQIGNEFSQMRIVAYVPPEFYQGKLLPVLILLPPQDGNEYFYFNHGLKELADELISEGAIQPMAIVCPSNDLTFGGYFWGSHRNDVQISDSVYSISGAVAAGNYDSLFHYGLIDYIDNGFIVSVYPDPTVREQKRGIGGIGMGAYGAFRAAIRNPGEFGSVSAIDGPLDFDGTDGNGGLVSLMDNALIEQGILGDPNWRTKFDSSGAWHLSRLFIGGALAFSPHDTALTYVRKYNTVTKEYTNTVVTGSRMQLADSTTLVTGVVVGDASSDFDFNLPFDGTGHKYYPIWNLWLANNLENMLNQTDNQLAGVNMWIATSTQSTFGNYHEQTQSFYNTLTSAPYNYPVEEYTYKGYPGKPAYKDQYLYDLMKRMLIFHSESFGN